MNNQLRLRLTALRNSTPAARFDASPAPFAITRAPLSIAPPIASPTRFLSVQHRSGKSGKPGRIFLPTMVAPKTAVKIRPGSR